MVKEIDIPTFDDVRTKSVPQWASEDTLATLLKSIQHIENIQTNISKIMAITSKNELKRDDEKLLKAIQKAITDGNKIAEETTKTTKKTKKTTDNQQKSTEENTKEVKKSNNFFKRAYDLNQKQLQEDKKYNKEHNIAEKKFIKAINNIPNTVTGVAKSAATGNLSGLVDGLTGAVTGILDMIPVVGSFLSGATAAAVGALGYVVSNMSEQATAVGSMINAGAGFNTSMRELSNTTGMLGINISDYAKIVTENSSAMLAFGVSVNNGSKAFTLISTNIKEDLKENFHQFGMGNSELLDAIAKEADLRRRTGESAVKIQSSLNSGMADLLYETTAMANLTGVDRRELQRTRQERAKQGAISSYAMSLSNDNEKANYLATGQLAAYGPIGKTIADAIQMGKATGTGLTGSPEFDKLIGLLGPGIGDSLRGDLENLYTKMGTMTSEEYDKQMVVIMGRFGKEFKNMDRSNLEAISVKGSGEYQTTATSILEFGNMVQGLPSEMKDVTKSFEELAAALKDPSNAILDLPSSIDDLANVLKASMFLTMLDSIDTITNTLGIDTTNMTPNEIMNALADKMKQKDANGNTTGVNTLGDILNPPPKLDKQTLLDARKDLQNSGVNTSTMSDAAVARAQQEKQFDNKGVMWNIEHAPDIIASSAVYSVSMLADYTNMAINKALGTALRTDLATSWDAYELSGSISETLGNNTTSTTNKPTQTSTVNNTTNPLQSHVEETNRLLKQLIENTAP